MDALEGRLFFAAGPTIAAPHSTVDGATLGEWSARWHQWALSFPNSQSPVTDTTGKNADLGQSGPVYFLAGTFLGGEPTVRTQVRIPAGKDIFFPIGNVFWVQLPEDPPTTIQERRDILNDFLTSSNEGITVSIDGTAVANPLQYHEVDPFTNGFNVTLPDENVFRLFGATAEQAPAGNYPGSVADGYYLMLTNVPNGNHTLRWSAPGLGQDITYQFQVVGRPARSVDTRDRASITINDATQGIHDMNEALFGDERFDGPFASVGEPTEVLV